MSEVAVLEETPATSAPIQQKRQLPQCVPFNSDTARAAGRKAAAQAREYRKIAKALAPAPLKAPAARLSQLRRLQRQALAMMSACQTAGDMLSAAKACRELFEQEMELLGRREAGKGGRSKGSKSDKPVAPDVTLPQ